MIPNRESHEYDISFPFVLMYRDPRNPKLDNAMRFHFHDWYEIVYVHDGEGNFFIDQSFCHMQEGEVFLIPGQLVHCATANQTNPYTVSVILFSHSLIHQMTLGEPFFYLEPFKKADQHNQYSLCLSSEQKVLLERNLFEMAHEMKQQERGYRHVMLNLLHTILAMFCRMSGDFPAKELNVTKSMVWMKEILAYIDSHLTEELSLSYLSQQSLVSASHFSRVFKEMTGFHLPVYLNTKRILKAKEFLLQSDRPLDFIANQCGFQGLSHFHKVFRKQIGCTPREYRNLPQIKPKPLLSKT